MPGQHALLSPSAAERWTECPASIRMQGLVPCEAESPYAAEGTLAHELAELKAALKFGQITMRQYGRRWAGFTNKLSDFLNTSDDARFDEVLAEMERHTDAYVELLHDRMGLYPASQLLLEQRLPTGLPDDGKGTSDAVIVSPEHVEIIDFKYGQGVAVEAKGNPQLRIYAHGALTTYGDWLGETQVVRMTVHQPRLNHVLTDELTPNALREWHASILPIAQEALGENAHFGPSETACRWCPASGRCAAQLEKVTSEDFAVDVDLLTPETVAATLARVPEIREWLKAFEEAALSMAYSEGQAIPGYKVVLSGGKRTVSDGDGAIRFLQEQGYELDQVSVRKVRGIGELEKLLGKDEFADQLSPFITKSTGQPSLVPESDKRTSIAPNTEAAKEFGELDE